MDVSFAQKEKKSPKMLISGRSQSLSQRGVKQYNGIILHDMHYSTTQPKRAVHTPLFGGKGSVAAVLLVIMGCLVQAIREALVDEVSVEIGKAHLTA